MKIYHNPRCSKSRDALKIIKQHTTKFEIIEYLKDPPSPKTIQEILLKLNIKAHDIIRKQENIWKNNYKNKKLSETEIINILAKHPILIERPIIVHKNQAIIGRPAENVLNLFC